MQYRILTVESEVVQRSKPVYALREEATAARSTLPKPDGCARIGSQDRQSLTGPASRGMAAVAPEPDNQPKPDNQQALEADDQPNQAPEPNNQPKPERQSKRISEPAVVKQSSLKKQGRLSTYVGHSFGIFEPKGTSDAMSKQWNSLSVVAALLTGVAAAGLFICAQFVHDFRAEKEIRGVVNQTSGQVVVQTSDVLRQETLWIYKPLAGFATTGFAKLTMMAFCIDTFCFLNATVLSTFFVAFQKRNSELNLDQMVKALGWWTFQSPRIYFRVGYYLMVLSFSMFLK